MLVNSTVAEQSEPGENLSNEYPAEENPAEIIPGEGNPTEESAQQDRATRAHPNLLLAGLKSPLLVLWIMVGALVMSIARLFNHAGWIERFPLLFHGTVARFFFNMRCEYVGHMQQGRPVMYVANHASYLDVFVLGGKIPGSFVAKSEVAGWPVFGKLARLQNTMFLERKAQRAASQITQVRDWLHNESNLILFPEGTSTSGDWVAPFRSSLFAAADEVTVQPVTVVYLDYQGELMSKGDRDHYAWYLPDPTQPVPALRQPGYWPAALP